MHYCGGTVCDSAARHTITLSCPRYTVSESGSVQYTFTRSRCQQIVIEWWTKYDIFTLSLGAWHRYVHTMSTSRYCKGIVIITCFVHCSITICWPRDRVKVYCADPDLLTVYPTQLNGVVLSRGTVTNNFTTIIHSLDRLNILCDFCHIFLSLSWSEKGGLQSDN